MVGVVIDSPHNQHVKFFRSLRDGKGRRESGCFLAEGARLIAEALAAEWPIEAAAVCRELLAPAAAEVASALCQGPWPCHEMTARAFRALTAEQSPQGVAIAARQKIVDLADLKLGPRDVVVGAWQLRDPGNLGTLVRTAEFLGCAGLVAVGECVDLFEPKTVRATAGAIFRLPLAEASEQVFVAWAKSNNVRIIATASEGGAPPDRLSVRGPVAVLIGSEAHGLPESALSVADAIMTISRSGKVDSLNAAVAAGICIYWAVGQLNKSGKGKDGEE
ncbi:MAG: RNA methyltransferase [Armatimonadetes bacterium]|nr:RNA methyltransferase [Armatimonadota bacterium]